MKKPWRAPAVSTSSRPPPWLALALPLLFAATTGPSPSPLPDATPVVRGAVNTSTTQRLPGKVFVDKVTVNADAGIAVGSTCVPRTADLGACPPGNGLQCVADAGWFSCLNDGGWSQLGTGVGSVTGVSATAPITSSGGASPTIACTPASDVSGGCLTDAGQPIGGAKHFVAPITTPMIDAGTVLTTNVEPAGNDKTLMLLGTESGGTATPDVIIGSAYSRTSSGKPVSFQAGGFELGYWDGVGDLFPTAAIQMTGSNPMITSYLTSLFGTSINFRSTIDGASVTSSFTFDTSNAKTAGNLSVWNNHSVTKMYLDYLGTLSTVADVNAPAFLDGTTSSGHQALTCTSLGANVGCYLYMSGKEPRLYWGHHGDTTIGSSQPRDTGWLVEVKNPQSGSGTDSKYVINDQGAFGQEGGYCQAQFHPCGNYDNAPVDDGGQGYFVGTDAGVAHDGYQMYDVCVHRWFQCVVATPPGGTWVQVKLVGD